MSSIHASCVSFGGVGVLIRGEPNSGKSSLCLRLLDAGGSGSGSNLVRVRLVSDDQVEIAREGIRLVARPPSALAGLLEVRGLGLVRLPYEPQVEIRLLVDLLAPMVIPRLPEPAQLETEIMGVILPRLMLDGKSSVATAILRGSLTHFGLLASP